MPSDLLQCSVQPGGRAAEASGTSAAASDGAATSEGAGISAVSLPGRVHDTSPRDLLRQYVTPFVLLQCSVQPGGSGSWVAAEALAEPEPPPEAITATLITGSTGADACTAVGETGIEAGGTACGAVCGGRARGEARNAAAAAAAFGLLDGLASAALAGTAPAGAALGLPDGLGGAALAGTAPSGAALGLPDGLARAVPVDAAPVGATLGLPDGLALAAATAACAERCTAGKARRPVVESMTVEGAAPDAGGWAAPPKPGPYRLAARTRAVEADTAAPGGSPSGSSSSSPPLPKTSTARGGGGGAPAERLDPATSSGLSCA